MAKITEIVDFYHRVDVAGSGSRNTTQELSFVARLKGDVSLETEYYNDGNRTVRLQHLVAVVPRMGQLKADDVVVWESNQYSIFESEYNPRHSFYRTFRLTKIQPLTIQ